MKWFKKKEETVNISDFEKELKKRKRAEKRQQRLSDIAKTVNENRESIAIISAVLIPVVGGACKMTSKAMASHRTNKEIRFKERHIYDRSLGRYVELKRKLRPAEAISIEERRLNGEKLNSILNDMGLLKG